MQVRNSSDLKVAYEVLSLYNKLLSEHVEIEQEKTKLVKEKIAEQKREIREFYKRGNDRRLVKDNGIDGYILLIELPETLENPRDAKEYFEENEAICAVPSMFDCTGQAFTSWFKVFKRRDRFMAYHYIGFDV